jgi:hypothetical protein
MFMTRRTRHELLDSAAKRLARDPKFMASALAALNGGAWNGQQISHLLKCEPATVVRIALCTRPLGSSAQFRSDVERIASLGKVPPGLIASAIRQAEALESFEKASERQLLAAARDRIDEDDSEED